MPCDYKDYPPNWKEIRERILLRAKNKCEFCGLKNRSRVYKSNREYVYDGDQLHYNSLISMGYSIQKALKELNLTEIVLTIAHLDHDKLNHDVKDDRLAALCQKCHLQYDLPIHINNRKYGRNYLKDQNKMF